MDNSVDYIILFAELSIREFWTECNIITRIPYSSYSEWIKGKTLKAFVTENKLCF